METRDLIAALRSTKSRSKRALLDEAADTIEALITDLVRSESRVLCDFCTRSHTPAPCELADFDCSGCTHDCPCKDCVDGSKFEWRGVRRSNG